ncbi:YueI family protein [Holzapfeliella floricola]|uniref:YueI family protein n=1 Tax=Holzapfeliella floricola TaxID=679249 RepID=UPI0007855DE8|nr:YueI family protein [Holzapfeliella floricola]
MTDNLTDRLEKNSMGSTPQTNPDERRQYLGSLRERVLVRLSVAQFKNKELVETLVDHIPSYQNYQVLINNKINTPNASLIIKSCSQNNIRFSLISDQSAQTVDEATGVLVVSKDAINESIIDITQKYNKKLILIPTISLRKYQFGLK